MKNNKRPIYLNIMTIQLPITAIVSILHRISGIFLFIIIGPVLWLFKLSLSSYDKFYKVTNFLLINNKIFKLLLWSVITTLGYHIIAGVRQMLIDFKYLEHTWYVGKCSAKIVFGLVILLFIASGILIWDPLN